MSPTPGRKRDNFVTLHCPKCRQGFKTEKAIAETMTLPDDCPVCAAQAENLALEAQLTDPTAVVDPRKLLGRILAQDAQLKALQQDIGTILKHLNLNGSGPAPVEQGSGERVELPV